MTQVFEALAEPTRRDLLARLRDDGELSLNELAAPLAMSRQAVTKHLVTLEDAGLVEIEWKGRVKLHRLNAEPLKVVEDWLAPYSAAWDRRFDRLRRHLEDNG